MERRIYAAEELAREMKFAEGNLLYLSACALGREFSPERLVFEVYKDWPLIKSMNHTDVEDFWRERISGGCQIQYVSDEATRRLLAGERNKTLAELKGSWETIFYPDEQTESNLLLEGFVIDSPRELGRLFQLVGIEEKPIRELKQMNNADTSDYDRFYRIVR